MGYTTEFEGQVTVTPPLNPHEIAYLRQFSESRRMSRTNGPYFIGSGFRGQGVEPDIRDYNSPPPGQPGLWCEWVPTEDGSAIEWDGGEKFYASEEWMTYLIDTFLKPGAALASELGALVPGRVYPSEFAHFTFDHELNGVIDAQGEAADDRWRLMVTGNEVTVQRAQVVFPDAVVTWPEDSEQVAGSEWQAGLRRCERCGPDLGDDDEPDTEDVYYDCCEHCEHMTAAEHDEEDNAHTEPCPHGCNGSQAEVNDA